MEILHQLCTLYYDSSDACADFTQVEADELPSAYQSLLAHHHHMTVTVEEFHHCRLDVQVLKKNITRRFYSRKILLAREADGKVVQFGIMRIALDRLSDEVRTEVESEAVPLGRVLIAHNVLRHVQCVSLLRVMPRRSLQELLNMGDEEVTYGRTARIHVDGEPAVQLLEIVTPV